MIDFKICEKIGCEATIKDLTDVIEGYNTLDKYNPDINIDLLYSYKDCCAIYVLTKVNSDGEEVLHSHIVYDPRIDMDVHFDNDGYHKISKILLPNKNILYTDFVNDHNGNKTWESYGKTLYFYDEDKETIFKVIKDEKTYISGSLIKEVNGSLLNTESRKNSKYLMVDINDYDLIEDTKLNDIDIQFYVKQDNTYSKYVICDSTDEDVYGIVYDLNDISFDWIDKNICLHGFDVEHNENDYPEIDDYKYVCVNDISEVLEQCDGIITSVRETKEIFVICHFRECVFTQNSKYIKICPDKCNTNVSMDSTILWLNTSLMVLEYLIECGRYMEAQQILEHLSVCGGPCKEIDSTKRKGCGCGQIR